MKSLLFQPTSPFPGVVPCPAGRDESTFMIIKNGFGYRFTVRSNPAVEDPYVNMVKACALAIKHGIGYPGGMPTKEVRDFFIKNSVQP